MQKLDPKTDGRSVDIVAENIDKLKTLFPEVFTEGGIDFDALKETLGEYIESREERYSFTWNGKSKARWLAQTPSTGTLRPCQEESVNWDTTQNLFIEGDNLEALKLLQKSYYKKVKMIYIDPPYNTGNDFIYPDDFRDNIKNYLEFTGQVDSEGRKLSVNAETSGRYHTDWLNMMYPRLKLARNLLQDDGVIFISIDDNEVTNLRKICDEIFGEENFVACLPTIMNLKGNNDQFGFAGTHELTVVYVKEKSLLEDLNGIPLDDEDLKDYVEKDDIGYYKQGATLMRTGEAGLRLKRPKGYYPIYVSKDLSRMSLERIDDTDYEVYPKTVSGVEMSWRRSPETLRNSISEFIIKETNNGISFYKKQRVEEDKVRGKKPKTLFYKPEYSSGNGTEVLKTLFNGRLFDNPKPVSLIKDFISVGLGGEGLILDFFSGSATTAHAVLDLNKEDGFNRKFILIQLPEPCDKKSEAFKAGYETIAEIGKERMRRVTNNIKDEAPKYKVDLGFKVFKLDSTNIKPWDVDFDNFERTLEDYITNIKNDRSEHDILYEILLKYGLELTLPIEERTIAGKTVFIIGYGALVICLADDITLEVVEGIADLKKELHPEIMRVVFKDTGFKSDVVKTNAVQILKLAGIEDVKSL